MPEQMFTVYLSKTDDLSGLIWTKKIYELSRSICRNVSVYKYDIKTNHQEI